MCIRVLILKMVICNYRVGLIFYIFEGLNNPIISMMYKKVLHGMVERTII